jgi:hypothetical protein
MYVECKILGWGWGILGHFILCGGGGSFFYCVAEVTLREPRGGDGMR